MNTREKPFWEAAYCEEDRDAFGPPDEDLQKLLDSTLPSVAVLDAGCGDGRNAIFLAERGFTVRAFDVSSAGIGKLRRKAKKGNLEVEAWVKCLSDFEFDRSYGLILACGLLQFVPRAIGDHFIEDARKHTLPGGVHVIGVFTDSEPPPADLAPFVKRLFADSEVCEIYADWDIEVFKSYVSEDEHEGGIHHRHAINDLVARKPWEK